ncbi:MAG: CerR family C-terminal domain-containing protein [Gammaproteobacteria bacterium]|nr:CerR family C-terminal domain-containing protein [Gammaproteobacteria bacterium]NND59838.1 CerR family C-terminal domain-containing protein [Gammaproteobacteria bacterium]
MSNSAPADRSHDTRERLLRASVRVFSELGFEAASTRQLASQAGVNLAAIPYHFESKKGLYLAVAAYVADQIGARLLPTLEGLQPTTDKVAARAALHRLVQAMIRLVAGEPEADCWAGFILREQAQPTEAFEVLYERTMGRIHETVAQLVGVISGLPADDPLTRLRSITLTGQVLVFRTSRAGVMRTLGWTEYDAGHLELIGQVIAEQVDCILDAVDSDAN